MSTPGLGGRAVVAAAVLISLAAAGVACAPRSNTADRADVNPVLAAVEQARREGSAVVRFESTAVGRHGADEITSTDGFEGSIIFGEVVSFRLDSGEEGIVGDDAVFYATTERLRRRGVTTTYVRIRDGGLGDEAMLMFPHILDEITERVSAGSGPPTTTGDGQSEVEIVSTDDDSTWTVSLTSDLPPRLRSVGAHVTPREPDVEGGATIEVQWVLTFRRFGGVAPVATPAPEDVTVVESLGRP